MDGALLGPHALEFGLSVTRRCSALRHSTEPAAAAVQRQLRGSQFRRLTVRNGSATPVRLIELLTYGVHRMSTGPVRPWATALENGRVRPAVALCQLYSETGHLIARMTGSGRQCEYAAATGSRPSAP